MRQTLIMFSGKKKAGKNALCNFLINNYNELFKQPKFLINLNNPSYPAALIGFADALKELISFYFNIPIEVLYSNEKDTYVTNIKWNTLPNYTFLIDNGFVLEPNNYLTTRELMQQIGAMFRKMNPNIWVDIFLKKVNYQFEHERKKLILCFDNRYLNELTLARNFCEESRYKFLSIKLTRQIDKDIHESEISLDDHLNVFDVIIDNQNLTLEQTKRQLIKILKEKGIIV